MEINPAEDDTNPYRYAGEYFDTETGDIYLRARYYNPSIGRFSAQDSVARVMRQMPNEQEIADPLSLNLYTYCYNSPVMYSDPEGHEVVLVSAGGVATFASIAWLASPDEQKAMQETAKVIYNGIEYTGDRLKSWYNSLKSSIGGVIGGNTIKATNNKEESSDKAEDGSMVRTDTKPRDNNSKFIYRGGSKTYYNLTPRITDTNGLSFYTAPPARGNYFVFSVDAINASGFLQVIFDKPGHAAVVPTNRVRLAEWIATKESANEKPHMFIMFLHNIAVKGIR